MSFKRISQGLFLALLATGCSAQRGEEPVAQARQALTAVQQRVLGFEAPTSDWTGGSITASSTVSEGAAALALSPNGWTVLTSVPLSSKSDAA